MITSDDITAALILVSTIVFCIGWSRLLPEEWRNDTPAPPKEPPTVWDVQKARNKQRERQTSQRPSGSAEDDR